MQALYLAAARDAAEHQRGRQMRALGQHAERFIDLHGKLAGRNEHQRARRLGAALGAERDDLGQDRQRERRGLAGAGLGDAQNVAAGELRRNGLDLDRLGFGIAGGNGGLEQRARDAECGEAFECAIAVDIGVFDIQFLLLSGGTSAAKQCRGRAQPAVKFDEMKRQGGRQIARAAALSCPPGSSERGSFAAAEMFGGRKQTQPVPVMGKAESPAQAPIRPDMEEFDAKCKRIMLRCSKATAASSHKVDD